MYSFDQLTGIFENLIDSKNLLMLGIGAGATIFLTLLLYVFVMPKRKDGRTNGFFQMLHNFFHFKKIYIVALLKFIYVVATVGIFCFGIVLMVYDFKNAWLPSLLMMTAGTITLRFSYELILLGILLVQNVIDINSELAKMNRETEKGKKNMVRPATPVVPVTPVAPAVPVAPVVPATPVAPAAPVAPVAPIVPVTPAASVEPDVQKASVITAEPEAVPEAMAEPVAAPEAMAEPEAASEAMAEPEAAPEASTVVAEEVAPVAEEVVMTAQDVAPAAEEVTETESVEETVPVAEPAAEEVPAQQVFKFCSNCGAKFTMDANFCDKCGTKL